MNRFLKIFNSSLQIFFIILLSGNSYLYSQTNFFNEILEANSKIKYIEADIVQNISSSDGEQVYKGLYRADIDGRLRIDYSMPEKQIVLFDGKLLYWYYPDDKIIYKSEKMPGNKPGYGPLNEFLYKNFEENYNVEYLGKHLFGFFSFAHNFIITNIKTKDIIEIWVDTTKKVILAKIVKNSDKVEILKEIYSDYVKIGNAYFPSRVDVYARSESGFTKNTTEYKNIKLNIRISDNVFKINVPPDVIHKRLDAGN